MPLTLIITSVNQMIDPALNRQSRRNGSRPLAG